jgi:hypothetical protein
MLVKRADLMVGVKDLPNFEGEVYLWIEQQSSVMLKATTKCNDPVELTAADARLLAELLLEAANSLEALNR